MDKLTPRRRSANMGRIRSRDSRPEWTVRRHLFGLGYRYRLHVKTLPGKPDLVFPGLRKVIFVHGCFWHQHSGCREGRIPGSRREYWAPKLAGNVRRDARNRAGLKKLGWSSITLWECEIESGKALKKAEAFLSRKG
ncbi:MAG: Very short patch repair protein [Myxococcota bacterium]|nr:Very short patch repair protein [Myxococcota bacterium]